ncbi:MAG: hypothetical protein JWN84_3446 [Nocardioides sp.]|nr:hypothetical protein [Nocardioides sp.]
MTAMSTAVGAGFLAHGLHVGMVLAGLWGLAALLLPHVITRFSAGPASYDDHTERVTALRVAVGAGAPGIAAPAASPAAGSASPARPTTVRRSGPVALPLAVPLAVVASATAAGIHAAVAPLHLREDAAAGLFFAVVACLQLAWAGAATRPTPRLLRAGLALHLGLVGLWLLTRTAGLPFGLQPTPHPVGAWDLTCVAWQLAAAAACAATLRHGVPARCPGWFEWHSSTRAAVGAAGVLLALLSLSGAPA